MQWRCRRLASGLLWGRGAWCCTAHANPQTLSLCNPPPCCPGYPCPPCRQRNDTGADCDRVLWIVSCTVLLPAILLRIWLHEGLPWLALRCTPHLMLMAAWAALIRWRRRTYAAHRELIAGATLLSCNLMVRAASAAQRQAQGAAVGEVGKLPCVDACSRSTDTHFPLARHLQNASPPCPTPLGLQVRAIAANGGANHFQLHGGSPLRLAALMLLCGHALWCCIYALYHQLGLGCTRAMLAVAALLPVSVWVKAWRLFLLAPTFQSAVSALHATCSPLDTLAPPHAAVHGREHLPPPAGGAGS